MTLTARIRFTLAALALAVGYFYLLIYIIGWMSAHHWPSWWFDVFSTSRRVGAVVWLVTLHTAAVLLAALPIGVAAVIIAREKAVLLALIAASLATAAAIAPSLAPTIWPTVWSSHPVFFVTDQIKLILAAPFVAWVLRAASSNNRFERSRVASSVS
jgi:hypothetical protein